jgi:hypothetical protein
MGIPRKNYRTTRDIVIPAGTVMYSAAAEFGGISRRQAHVALGPDFTAVLLVRADRDALDSGYVEELV